MKNYQILHWYTLVLHSIFATFYNTSNVKQIGCTLRLHLRPGLQRGVHRPLTLSLAIFHGGFYGDIIGIEWAIGR